MSVKLLIIDATTRCNQKCIFCFERDMHFTKPDLSFEKIKSIVRAAKKDGFTHVNFIGGEITLVSWLPEAIRFIKKNRMKVGIVTNGILFSNARYAQKIIGAGLDHAELSFHSHISKDDFIITGLRNGFVLRKRALANISRLRKEFPGFSLYINIVVNTINYVYLDKIIVFLQKFHIDAFDIKVLQITDNVKDTSIIPRFRVIKKHLNYCMELMKERGVRFHFENIPLCCIEPRHYLNSLRLVDRLKRNTTGGYGFNYGDEDAVSMNFEIFEKGNIAKGGCTHCVLKRFCSRPQREYLTLFGDAEFRPVRSINSIKKHLRK